jgi:spermidine synthase
MSSHQKNPRGVRRSIDNQGRKRIEKPQKPLVHGTEAKARYSVLLGISLFFSGTAALVFQVLWVKQLSLVVGAEVYSVTIAVSAFFAGLALGGALLGRFADRWQRPLLLYASLETAVAITGVTTTMALSHTPAIFAFLSQRVGILAWLLPFFLVGIPAFVMGGTIPAATRWRALQNLPIAQSGAWVYAANTAGGICGALASSFVFLRWLGVIGTGIAAAVFNVLAAVIVWRLQLRSELTSSSPANIPSARQKADSASRNALVLYAVSGAIALGYEVVWSQAMPQFLSTRAFAFSVVLATYLAGLALGSALFGRFGYKVRDRWGTFALLISGAGVVALIEIAFLDLWQLRIQFGIATWVLAVTGSELARMCAHFLMAALGIVFVPTVALGAAFPAVLSIAGRDAYAGQDVGVVLSLNTVGGIAGTLLTGFVLLPALGVVRTLGVLAVAACMVGIIAIALAPSMNRKLVWLVSLLGLVAVGAGILTPSDRLSRLLLTTRGGGDLIFYREGAGGTVAVAQQKSGDNVFRRLYIQGVSNSGDAMTSLRYMRLQALLPLLIHRGDPRSVLVIGYGTGITAGAALHDPQIQRVVCAETLPAVIQAGDLFPESYKASSDPRIQIRIRDGRQELLRSAEQYDLITLEPPPPSAERVANLYSTEFYQLAARRLRPDGLFAQWLPLSTQNDEDTRTLVRSFLDGFPFATLWTTELNEMLLIGSYSPIELDADRIGRRFEQPAVQRALNAVGIFSPASLLATWVMERDGLERYAGNALPVTDNHPRIEYAPWVRPKEITRTLPELLALRSDPKVAGGNSNLAQQVQQQRQSLTDFYTAGLEAYSGDKERWSQAMQHVLAEDASNPYYRWIAGD